MATIAHGPAVEVAKKASVVTILPVHDDNEDRLVAATRKHLKYQPSFIQTVEELVNAYEITQRKLRNVQEQLALEKAAHQKTKDQLTKEKCEHQKTRDQLTKEQADHQKTKDELKKIQIELRAVKDELKATKTELEKIKAQLAKTQEELKKTQSELCATKEELAKTKEELAKVKADLQKVKAELATAVAALAAAQAEISKLKSENATLRCEKEKLQTELAAAKKQISTLQTELKEAQDDLEAEKKNYKELQARKKETEEEYRNQVKETVRIDGLRDGLQTEVTQLRNELRSTTSGRFMRKENRTKDNIYIDEVIYGGKIINTQSVINKLLDHAVAGTAFEITNSFIGEDPWKGTTKTFTCTYVVDGKAPFRYVCAQERTSVKFATN